MKKNENVESEQITGNEALIKTNGNKNELPMQQVDLNQADVPDLDDAEVVPFDLNSEYWTPKLPGETKRMYFDTIKISPVVDANNKDVIIELPCAFFFEKVNGEVKTVRNGSKRLVAMIENNNIQRGTALQVEYLGKKKNSTNSYMSDDWSCKPLVIKIK